MGAGVEIKSNFEIFEKPDSSESGFFFVLLTNKNSYIKYPMIYIHLLDTHIFLKNFVE